MKSIVYILLIAIFALYTTQAADVYQSISSYSGSSCSGSGGLIVTTKVSSCKATACACANGYCVSTKCYSGNPSYPKNYAGYGTFSDSNCTNLIASTVYTPNCTPYILGSYTSSCNNGNVTVNLYTLNTTCGGTPVVSVYDSSCNGGLGIYTRSICGSGSQMIISAFVLIFSLILCFFF